MNKEEKETLESLRKNRGVSFEQADIISNLINKQQKEIEELNTEILELTNQITDGFWKNDRLKKKIEKLKGIHQEFLKLHQGLNAEGTLLSADNILNAIEKKYISKDKIKKILGIEEDEEDNEEKILSLLQTIVDECYRLEDVEDRKVQVEVDNIEEKRDKYWKDKIRKKMKEIGHYKKLANECIEERIIIADSDSLNYGRKEAHEKDIEMLKELLEE